MVFIRLFSVWRIKEDIKSKSCFFLSKNKKSIKQKHIKKIYQLKITILISTKIFVDTLC